VLFTFDKELIKALKRRIYDFPKKEELEKEIYKLKENTRNVLTDTEVANLENKFNMDLNNFIRMLTTPTKYKVDKERVDNRIHEILRLLSDKWNYGYKWEKEIRSIYLFDKEKNKLELHYDKFYIYHQNERLVNMWENSDKVLDRFFKNKIKG